MARQLDLELGDVNGTLTGLGSLAAQAVQDSSGDIAKAFDAIGVSYRDMSRDVRVPDEARNAVDIFSDLITKMKSMPDNKDRRSLISTFFGDNQELARRLLDAAPNAFGQMLRESSGLGRVFDQKQVDAAQAYKLAVNRLTEAFRGLVTEVGTRLMPRLAKGLDSISGFISRNRTLIADGVGKAFDFVSDAMDDIVNMLDGRPELVKHSWLLVLSGVLQTIGYWAKEVFKLIAGGQSAGVALAEDGQQFIATMDGAPSRLQPALDLFREIKDVLLGDEGNVGNSWVVRNLDALRNIRGVGLRAKAILDDIFALMNGRADQVKNPWVQQLWDIFGQILRVVKEVSASILGIKLDGDMLPLSQGIATALQAAGKFASELFAAFTGGTPDTEWAKALQGWLATGAGYALDIAGVLVGLEAKTDVGKSLAGWLEQAKAAAVDIYNVLFNGSSGETNAGQMVADALLDAETAARKMLSAMAGVVAEILRVVEGVIQAVLIAQGMDPASFGADKVPWAEDLAKTMQSVLGIIKQIESVMKSIVPMAKQIGRSASLGADVASQDGAANGVAIGALDMVSGGFLSQINDIARQTKQTRGGALLDMMNPWSDLNSGARSAMRPAYAVADGFSKPQPLRWSDSYNQRTDEVPVNINFNGGTFPMRAERSVVDQLAAAAAASNRASVR